MSAPRHISIRPISGPLDVSLRLPGSKSLTNRALLIAALAQGVSTLRGMLIAEDTHLMMSALRSLGVAVACDESSCEAVIQGVGGNWPHSEADLYCGNAGTVIRFLTAACASGSGAFRLDGNERMRERPIGPLVDALKDLGTSIGYEGRPGFCPLTIAARGLKGGRVSFERPVSSQFLSAVLLAAPRAVSDVLIRVNGGMTSQPYVTMTIAVMRHFGVEVVQDQMQSFVVPAPQYYQATTYDIEPDASTASYFVAAAALTGGSVRIEGLGSDSVQGDLKFVDILREMGCTVEQTAQATTVTGPAKGSLKGVDADMADMPDTVQTLAILSAFANRPTTMRNVGSLRVKETDRLLALSTELSKMGVQTELHGDDLRVIPQGQPHGAEIDTYDDHRMAMSFAVAALVVEGIVINDPECVQKSFPGFFEVWEGMRRK